MKTPIAIVIAAIFSGALLPSFISQANELSALQSALTDGNTDILLRYRYERVEQDSFDKDANASTLLTRLSYKSADYQGFFTQLEFDHVTAIGNDNYNSTVNGKTQYPVVADPTGSDFNQAYLGYRSGNLLVTAGRQRINHNDQRFVGGVGWRQNEQTYDGYRLQYELSPAWKIDYSYVHNVNRIFGNDSPNSDLDGNLHLFNSNYALAKSQQLSGFVYELDFDTAHALATRTYGVNYDGKVGAVKIHAAYAYQTETGDNPANFSADYFNLDLSTQLAGVNFGVGYESLGSDNGVGFSTPLATLHKFQGFTDKFLGTPAEGLNDVYLKASGAVGKLGLSASWHDFTSDVDDIDYGNEFNITAKYPLADKVGLLVKYANYNADSLSDDTNKLWGMLTFKF
ncbi:alginate export family protein [Pseudidiomarina sp. CB1]|uniref:alginate export family protein n=1 Tax=Pseudidiomarina sp. CB1 TaxID=2972484 RepID=UPI002162D88B|nr:alginate export family protein [Pseudidiomarina sp. CB1]